MRPRAVTIAGAIGSAAAVTVLPLSLLEDVVVAAKGNTNIRPRRHVETTCKRGGS